jgi:hypothetical protein
MNLKHWLMLLGIPSAGVAAVLLGSTVFGQVETKPLLPAAPLEAKPGTRGNVELPPQDLPPGAIPDVLPLPPKAVTPPPAPQVEVPPLVAPPAKPVEQISYDVAPGKQHPAVSVEWVGPAAIRINQPMPCQLVVRNTSTATVQNVVVRHRPGAGVTCKAAEPKATHTDGELSWDIGTLAPEQVRKIDLVLVPGARGVVNCHASVTFTAVAGHQIQVREPMLAIKMRGPDKVIAGENATFLVAISNPGDGIAEGVRIKAVLPDGLEYTRGKTPEFEVGNIAPKEIRTMQIVCAAKGAGPQKCTIIATGEGNLTSTDVSQVDVLAAKLDVALTGPKLCYLDRHAVYVLKVSNPGTAPATGVEVHELIPAGFKFHQANQGGKFHEGTRLVSWAIGDLQPGQSKDVAVDLIPIEPGEHRLVAQAKAARGLKTDVETRTLVEGLPSLLFDVSHVDDPIEIGAESAFEIRIVNTGTKSETNVQLICTLPEQLAFRGAKCSTTLRYRQDGQELIFEPVSKLAPKADVIVRVQVRGVAAGDARFRARISADGLKSPVQREENMRVYSDELPTKPAPLVSPILPKNDNTAPPVVGTPIPEPQPIAPAPLPPKKDDVPLRIPDLKPLESPTKKDTPAPKLEPTPIVPAPKLDPSPVLPMPELPMPTRTEPAPLDPAPQPIEGLPAPKLPTPSLPAPTIPAPSVPTPSIPPPSATPAPILPVEPMPEPVLPKN